MTTAVILYAIALVCAGLAGIAYYQRSKGERERIERQLEERASELEAASRTDELTRLPNRRAFAEELGREIGRARRNAWPLCVGMLALGRPAPSPEKGAGEDHAELLREASEAWRPAVRVTDYLARYGDEEFALLLPNCPLDMAFPVIDRIRTATPRGLSLAAGVAAWDEREEQSVLGARTIAALEAARAAGPNRTVAAQPFRSETGPSLEPRAESGDRGERGGKPA